MTSVGIIGAGIAGLTCAQRLRAAGFRVTVWDKSRGVGGRLATRSTESGRAFDHGAQYFTVREPSFLRQVERWRAAGLADLWRGRIVSWKDRRHQPLENQPERYVGVPGMNVLAKSLAVGLNVQTRITVKAIEHARHGWRVIGTGGEVHGPFDSIISTAPAPQTARLFNGHCCDFLERIPAATMSPCWAVMIEAASPITAEFEAAFVHDSPISWVAKNSSKPRRDPAETWVLHASSTWSQNHLGLEPAAVSKLLWAEFANIAGAKLSCPHTLIAHLWRYATPTQLLPERFLWNADTGLGACGDWCGGPRVEGAFLSGAALAAALMA